MKDLRTLLPSAVEAELTQEVHARLQRLIEEHGATNIYGELKTFFAVSVSLEIRKDYPYVDEHIQLSLKLSLVIDKVIKAVQNDFKEGKS